MTKREAKSNIHVYHLGICKNHGELCGIRPIKGAKDNGKCCEGSICLPEAGKLGGILKCEKGIFLVIQLCHSSADI